MAEELRLALILLGSLAIGAVILHGIWTVRKTVSEERAKAREDEPQIQDDIEETEIESEALKLQQMEMDFNTLQSSDSETGLPVANVDLDAIYRQEGDKMTLGTENASSNASLESSGMDTNIDSAPPSATGRDLAIENGDMELVSFSALEPFEGESLEPITEPETTELETTQKKPAPAEPEDVLMLFVDKSEGAPIEGAKLLPILLTLGFKFGDLSFFHRHQDNSGKGEVLFSLANMYNPGTFDIDHMEQMSTRGLTIFMTLPNAADPLQTFNMMHNAAKKIADEFDARVLDQKRQALDVAIVRGYVERIRKFQG
mgnify:CR=1 FL=1